MRRQELVVLVSLIVAVRDEVLNALGELHGAGFTRAVANEREEHKERRQPLLPVDEEPLRDAFWNGASRRRND